ncbi:MAG: hypothetical protein KDC92_07020 [Bacteroidetes bacterium]|nr:hypothetical protein [Bacteroidota bacterium]
MFRKFLALTLTASMFLMGISDAYATYTPKIKNIRIRQTTESNAGSYKIVVIVKHDDADEVANVETQLSPVDNGPDVSGSTIKMSLDKSASTKSEKFYTAEVKFKGDADGYEYEVVAVMKDAKGGKVGSVYTDYNVIGKDDTANENSYSECKSTFKMDKSELTTASVNGIFAVNIQFVFDSKFDQPEYAVAAVKLQDCNGNSTTIKLRVKYDSKTGTYVATTALKDDAKCGWEIVAAEIGAYNQCDDLSAWAFNLSQLKGNGRGTRISASDAGQTQQTELL